MFAQDFARASDFKVVHGEVEARAQVLQRLNGVKALLRILRECAVGRRQKVGVRLMVRAPDAASQLMELREAELVRALDDDGVRGRNVNARFNNGGAEKQVESLLIELAHHALELALMHLTVSDRNAGFGDKLFEPKPRVLHGFDFVVKEVDLAAALQFAQDRLADRAVLVALHECFDGEPPLGSRRNDGEVADSFEAHRERAGNRRSRERKHVDFGADFPQKLLLAHAEAVLLVNDDESEVLEVHLVGKELVRADDDIDRSVGEAFERLRGFLPRTEAREFGNRHGPCAEAVAEGGGVLFGQKRCRAEDCNLAARHRCNEGGAERNFGFPESNVAADEAVHGLAGSHVAHDRFNGACLIGRFVEGEALPESLVVVGIELEFEPFAGLPQGIKVEEFSRGVAHLFGGFSLRLLPVSAAELVERRMIRVRARVAGDKLQIRDRHEELRFVLVFDLKELGLAFARFHAHEPAVAPDAVVGMHDGVAGLQFRHIAHHHFERRRVLHAPQALPPGACGIEFGFREDDELFFFKDRAGIERRRGDIHLVAGSEEVSPRVDGREFEAARAEELRHRFLAPRGGR